MGLLVVGITTIILTLQAMGPEVAFGDAFKLASKKAPEMGVAAMAVSLVIVPVVSAFTKKFEAAHIASVFKNPEEN